LLTNDQIRINEPIQTIDDRWSLAVRSAIQQNTQILNLIHIPGTEFVGNLLRGNRLGGWHFGGTIPMSNLDNPNTCTPRGELRSIPGVFIVDSAAFPSIPGTTVALLSMANAARIARLWVEKRTT
jgi:choline dehydrogenase-like flavoprotein